MSQADICIIGAGIAALSAARVLREAGHSVVLLEKSRGLGGRAATRRIDGIPVDHGAQFFTARSEEFRAQTTRWITDGVCFEWCRGFHQWKDGILHPPNPAESNPRYACREGMTALSKHLSEGLNVQRESKVSEVARDGTGFTVTCEDGTSFQVGAVLSSAPVPQTLTICANLFPEGSKATLADTSVVPCLSVVAETPSGAPEWSGIQSQEGSLSWLGADSSKRQNPSHQFIVLHASTDFSVRHLESDLNAAAGILLRDAASVDPETLSTLTPRHVHRWRYARAENPFSSQAFLRPQADRNFYIIGDAFLTGKIESAWLSGRAAAQDLLSHPTP